MSRPLRYSILTAPDAPPLERDTITCVHCQRIVHVKPGTGATVYLLWVPAESRWVEEMGAMCAKCNAPVCLPCCDLGVCVPWERQLERLEARARLHRAVGV